MRVSCYIYKTTYLAEALLSVFCLEAVNILLLEFVEVFKTLVRIIFDLLFVQSH